MRIEEYNTLFGRSQLMKEFIRNHLKFTDIKQGQKVAIVGHSSFLKCITADGVENDELVGGADMKNC